MRRLNVAIIATPKSEYMKYLCNALDKLNDRLSLTVCTSASASNNMNYARNVKYVWTHSSWKVLFQISKEILLSRPHIVHFQFEYGIFGRPSLTALVPFLLLFLWIARIKVVTTIHLTIPFTDNNFIAIAFPPTFKVPITLTKIFLILLYSSIACLCPATVVHADLFKQYLVNYYHFSREKIYVIPHGIFFPERDLNKESKKFQFWKDKFGNKKVILCFGSLTPRKGLEYLVEAFNNVIKKHPEQLLVIAGFISSNYSVYIKKIERLIEKLNISDNVLITGPLDRESIHVLHDLADIVVLPYLFSLGASGSLPFAIQHSKPIVASGMLAEGLRNGMSALLVPPKDVQALVRAIERLIEDKAIGARLSRNLSHIINERSWEKVAQMTANVYRKLETCA